MPINLSTLSSISALIAAKLAFFYKSWIFLIDFASLFENNNTTTIILQRLEASMERRRKKSKKEDDEEDEEEDDNPTFSVTAEINSIIRELKEGGDKFPKNKLHSFGNPEKDALFFEEMRRHPLLVYDPLDESFSLSPFASVDERNLIDKISESKTGISREELVDVNPLLNYTIRERLREGSFLPLKGQKHRHVLMLYPRGNSDFRVPLNGTVRATKDSPILETSHDFTSEVRRGDVIIIEGIRYRVSSEERKLDKMTKKELKEYIEDLEEVPPDSDDIDTLIKVAHALTNKIGVIVRKPRKFEYEDNLEELKAPYSSSSVAYPLNFDKKAFKYDFTPKALPIDPPYRGSNNTQLTVYKYGCTNDVRDVYHKIVNAPEYKLEGQSLDNYLSEKKILSQDILNSLNRNKVALDEAVKNKRLEDHAKRRKNLRRRG